MTSFNKISSTALFFLFPFFAMAQIGNPAPDFTVTDVNDNTHRLYDYLEAGKVVVIDFYYTTCGPCQFYSPQVNLAYGKYGCNTANVVFLSIDYDDTDAEVVAYDNEYAIEFPSISGLEGGGNAVVSQYQIIGFPTFYVIDSSKTIIDVIDPPTLQVFDFRFAMHGLLPASCTTSLQGTDQSNQQISLFPNPVRQGENLQLSLPGSISGNTRYEIYDFMGRMAKAGEVVLSDVNQFEVQMNAISPGMYFIKISKDQSSDHFLKTFSVLKN